MVERKTTKWWNKGALVGACMCASTIISYCCSIWLSEYSHSQLMFLYVSIVYATSRVKVHCIFFFFIIALKTAGKYRVPASQLAKLPQPIYVLSYHVRTCTAQPGHLVQSE